MVLALQVAVSTVLGTPFPHALLTIISAHKVGKEASPVLTEQVLKGYGIFSVKQMQSAKFSSVFIVLQVMVLISVYRIRLS